MARAALPHLKRGGSIINSGSETGMFGSKHLLDYSATKGAIHAFTKSLASNLLERGIRVNAVAPGPGVDAAQSGRQAGEDVAEVRRKTATWGGRRSRRKSRRPTCSWPRRCAASYVNGIVLPVMGGPYG